MLFLRKPAVFFLWGCLLAPVQASDAGLRTDAVVDWRTNKIYLRAEWSLNRRNAERATGDLRAEMRSALLVKLSTVVEALLRRGAQGDEVPAPDLSAYWSRLKLNTFQVAENRASATLDINLRGQNSLMAYLPAETGKEDWRSDDAAANVAYERRTDLKEYDESGHEPVLYTGVVIDARHLNFIPSVSTAIFTSSGRQIYGQAFLSRPTLVKRGAAGFVANESHGDARQRIGQRPLKVPALDLARMSENSLVISDEDAAKLLAHDGSVKNLRRARVVILVSPDRLSERY